MPPYDLGQFEQTKYAISSCRGKEAMLPAVARKVAKRMKRRVPSAEAYRCKHCGLWHVGTRDSRFKGAPIGERE